MVHVAADRDDTRLPTEEQCRAQIERILESADFDVTDRERLLLRYVAEETLSGRGNRIKAYSIAVEVFGRSSAFDPQNDPIVRIAASHLRRSLERYYLMGGKADPILVTIPKGCYVPTFTLRVQAEDGADAMAPPPALGMADDRAPPDAEAVRRQVGRILSSPEFPRTGRSAAFLNYVVEEVLAGRDQRIKGYSIAVEVFGRPQSFTQDDPVVRVEAGRLRRSLERYYLVAGQADPVRIDIPKGCYVPTFAWKGDMPADRAGEPVPVLPAPAGKIARPWRLNAAIAALAVVATGAAWWLGAEWRGRPGPAAEIGLPDRPTLVVVPFADLGDGSRAEIYARGLTEEMLTALARFKEIKVFGRETSQSLPSDIGAAKIRSELGADYLLAGGIRASGSNLRVTARLIDTSDGHILWSQDYDNDLASRDLLAIQSDVASKVATAVAQPYGVIAHFEPSETPPDDLGTYECTLTFYTYRAELSAERHADVRSCLEKAVARYPAYATAWAMLSIAYLDEERFKFNQAADGSSGMKRALQAARRAIQLDPGNTRGLQALMMALFFNEQYADAMRIGEQALATNPNDTELLGELGTRVAMGGDWVRGAVLLDRALALNPGGGGYYHGTRALAAYFLNDNKTAVAEIQQADLEKFPLFYAVAAVIYAQAGMDAEARQAGETFMRMRPDFVPNIKAELAMRNFRAEDQLRLISALRKAGLPVQEGTEAAIAEAAKTGAGTPVAAGMP